MISRSDQNLIRHLQRSSTFLFKPSQVVWSPVICSHPRRGRTSFVTVPGRWNGVARFQSLSVSYLALLNWSRSWHWNGGPWKFGCHLLAYIETVCAVSIWHWHLRIPRHIYRGQNRERSCILSINVRCRLFFYLFFSTGPLFNSLILRHQMLMRDPTLHVQWLLRMTGMFQRKASNI